jgi:predicted metalloendopeptidase
MRTFTLLLASASLASPQRCRTTDNNRLNRRSKSGIDLAAMDKTVKPDDFYHYANGSWFKNTEIPPCRSAPFVRSRLGERMDGLMAVAKSDAGAGSTTQGRRLSALHKAGIDARTRPAQRT